MINIELNKAQYNKLINNLDSFSKGLDFKRSLKESGEFVVEEAKRNFATQGYTLKGGVFKNGKHWAPLAQSTKNDRKRNGYSPSRPMLIRTRKLINGFKMRSEKDSVLVYNDVEYAKYHQEGGKKIPQRVILDITNKTITIIGQNLAKFIEGNIKKFLK